MPNRIRVWDLCRKSVNCSRLCMPVTIIGPLAISGKSILTPINGSASVRGISRQGIFVYGRGDQCGDLFQAIRVINVKIV
jgi:hypothetical protein